MSGTGIPYLSPHIPGPEYRKRHKALRDGLFRKVVEQAAVHRDPRDLMFEVYLAGLFHGATIIGKNPEALALLDKQYPAEVEPAERRVVDRIIIKRRGRPRRKLEEE